MGREYDRIPFPLIFPMALGTVLTPVNSSIVSIALVVIATDFNIDAATVTWVISAFFLMSSIGQPLMGRFADRFGPRRIFLLGMVIVALSGVVGPFAPNIGILAGVRAMQALGAAAAYPSAVAMIRSLSISRGSDVQHGLSVIATVNGLGAAVGPFVGGFIVVFGGWQALFWINIPLALIAFVACWVQIPHDTATERPTVRAVVAGSDVIGIGTFSIFIIAFMMFVLSVTSNIQWWLLPVAVTAVAVFVRQEYRSPAPFINMRMLRRNRPLLGVYGHFILYSVLLYCLMYGVPQWLEAVEGYTPAEVGLLVFPFALLGGVFMPTASWLIRRIGVRVALTISGVLYLAGWCGILLFGPGIPPWFVVVVLASLGIPNSITNLGLQTRMYSLAQGPDLGTAAGLFQTSRFVGGILATGVLGIIYASKIDTPALDTIAIMMIGVSVVVLVLGLRKSAGESGTSVL